MKNNKGITLIALVVTIIVLLILAGVSIAMLTGDNGILNRASQSSVANAIGEGKDQVALRVSELTANYYDHKYNGVTVTPAVTTNQTMIDYITTNLNNPTLNKAGAYTVAYNAASGSGESATSANITVTSEKDNTKNAVCTIDANGVIGSWTNNY